MKKKSYLIFGVIIILIIAAYLLYPKKQSVEKQDSTFAECLTKKGYIMAGTEWCSHCKNQKAMFGESFKHIDFRDCDIQKEYCTEQGVRGYPTWILPDGTLSPGVKPLEVLSQMSGCSL